MASILSNLSMAQLIYANLAVIVVYATLWYLAALRFRRNDLADIAWGLGFIVVGVTTSFLKPNPSWRAAAIFTLVTVWAIRLSTFIFSRARGKKEDFRYQKMREDWGKNTIWRAYLQIFVMQGLILIIISLPVIYGMSASGPQEVQATDVIGIALWLIGFGIEATADAQMAHFRKNKTNPEQIMNTGLWRYSRHPNYFGEATLWWGIYLVALPTEGAWISAIGPACLTFLLLKVSGVPLLEKKYKTNAAYRAYQQNTSGFIPLPPKK